MQLFRFDFPPVKEADAMFMAQVAPEWQDGNECFRYVEKAFNRQSCETSWLIHGGLVISLLVISFQNSVTQKIDELDTCFKMFEEKISLGKIL